MLEIASPLGSRSARRGFTLIELVVVIAILAIVAALAAPSFIGFLRSSELSSVANSFIASVNAARSEAMKRNLPAMVMPLDDRHRDWSKGFVAFVDMNRNGAYDEGDFTVLRQPIDAAYLSFSGNGSAGGTPAYVRYDGSGFARKADGSSNNLSLTLSRNDVSGSANFAQTRRIFILRTGRTRVCTPASATDTTCQFSGSDD
ncbi:MAG: GspH/FimT family pseudopilin [Variovorax sp.]